MKEPVKVNKKNGKQKMKEPANINKKMVKKT